MALFQLHSTFQLGVMSFLSFVFTVHLNGEINLATEMFSTPKPKELQ